MTALIFSMCLCMVVGSVVSSDWMTIRQVTREFFPTVSPFTVRRWIAKGVGIPKVKLPATRFGKAYVVRRSDAELFAKAITNPELYRRQQATERCEKAKRRLEKAGA